MKTAFLFTGQGSQFAGMGKDLAEHHDVAREVFAEADAALGGQCQDGGHLRRRGPAGGIRDAVIETELHAS